MNFNKDNFYKNSYGEFIKSELPNREPDFKSESGSMYWYTEKGVYRLSDHWDQVASCFWEIDADYKDFNVILHENRPYDKSIVGFCKWEDFSEIVVLKHPLISEKDYSWLKEHPCEDYEINEYYTFIEFETSFVSKMICKTPNSWPVIEEHPNHWQTDFITIVK